MESSTYTVIKDTREKDGLFFPKFERCNGMMLKKLDTGDYTIQGHEHRLGIERKGSVSELSQNLLEERFYRELDRMKVIPHRFLLLEFTYNDILTFPRNSGIPQYKWPEIKIRPDFILKKLIEVQLEYEIQTVFCGDKDGLRSYMTSLFKRITDKYA